MKPEKLKILLVEDEPESLNVIRQMLMELGIQKIEEARDGAEALDIMEINGNVFDLVISDWNMPRTSGIELLRRIRIIAPDTPFLMITARGDIESVKEAKISGVAGYIRKPFSLDELTKKVQALTEK